MSTYFKEDFKGGDVSRFDDSLNAAVNEAAAYSGTYGLHLTRADDDDPPLAYVVKFLDDNQKKYQYKFRVRFNQLNGLESVLFFDGDSIYAQFDAGDVLLINGETTGWAPALGTWYYVKFELIVDSLNGRIKFWVDDVVYFERAGLELSPSGICLLVASVGGIL